NLRQVMQPLDDENSLGQEIGQMPRATTCNLAIDLCNITCRGIRANGLDPYFTEIAAEIVIEAWLIFAPPVSLSRGFLFDVQQVFIPPELEEDNIVLLDSDRCCSHEFLDFAQRNEITRSVVLLRQINLFRHAHQ